MSSRLTRRRLLALGLAAAALAACGKKQPRGQAVARGATVLALGDSITFGTGAAPDASYPAALARLTGWNIVNAGVPGDVTAGTLARLPALLQEHAPVLVLVSIGGNDLLRRLPEPEARASIRSICQQILASGAQVLLIAVPRPTISAAVAGSLSDHPMYAELASELKLPLHASGWSGVLGDKSLRSDTIHANAQGYERFAQGLLATLKAVGLFEAS
jgi:acyl-CoA thioesterase-1